MTADAASPSPAPRPPEPTGAEAQGPTRRNSQTTNRPRCWPPSRGPLGPPRPTGKLHERSQSQHVEGRPAAWGLPHPPGSPAPLHGSLSEQSPAPGAEHRRPRAHVAHTPRACSGQVRGVRPGSAGDSAGRPVNPKVR